MFPSFRQLSPGVSIQTVAPQPPGHEMETPSIPTILLPFLAEDGGLALALHSAQLQVQPALVKHRDRRKKSSFPPLLRGTEGLQEKTWSPCPLLGPTLSF